MAEEIKVRIDWESDEDKLAAFANHLIATFDGSNYTMRFYQVLPPAQFAIDPQAAQQVETVKGRHVITLVVNATSMPAMVGVLQGLLEHNTTEVKE